MSHKRRLPSVIADIIHLLVKQPRTVRELVNLTGMCSQAIQRYLNALIDEGLLFKSKRKDTSKPFIYTWNYRATSWSQFD